MPVREEDRIYTSYGAFLRTFTAFGSAIWVFLVGSALPGAGNTRLAIIGYACGLVLGIVPVVLSAALPSFRYGVDSIDCSKAAFGVRGAYLPLLGLLITSVGWAAVVMAMVARGVALLLAQAHDVHAVADERLITGISFATILACWLLLRGGMKFVQRLNDFVGPGLIVLATVSLVLLLARFGALHVWERNVAPEEALTRDHRKAFAYALEFGVAASLGWWPFVGGFYRLLKYRRDAVGPCVIGASLVGGAYCSGVAALAAVSLGTADPLLWIINLAGRSLGGLMVCLILLMNIPTICMLVYCGAVSVQQVRALARIPWNGVVALMLSPLAVVAFYTLWAVTHIMTITTYTGLQFLGVTAIGVVDYYLLRRQSINLPQLFVAGPRGEYWFWHGVNWVAMSVVVVGVAAYLALYDPVSLAASSAFRYLGAGLPVMVGSALLYYVLARLITIPSRRGGYLAHTKDASAAEADVQVGL